MTLAALGIVYGDALHPERKLCRLQANNKRNQCVWLCFAHYLGIVVSGALKINFIYFKGR